MDEMRQMLDQLMGSDRNLTREERKHYKPKTRSYRDRDVCKYWLCGFCPYEEFRRTKNDCGDCPCLHDEDAKREWDALDDRSKERTGYEADLKIWMDRLLVDLQKRIDTNTERLKATEKPLFLVEDQQRLDGMSARINELVGHSQVLGEQGDVDGAQQALMEAESIKVQRSVLEAQAQARAGNNATKGLQQAVCPISGLIINKEESRIKDHESGRNFNSWRKMHEVYAKVVEDLRRREGGGRRRSPPPPRERRRSRSRERERERQRDRGSSHRDDRRGSYRDDRDRRRDGDSRRRDYDDKSRNHDRRDRERERDRQGRDRRDRSPGRPSRPRVDESEFVVEYTNSEAAAAASKKQQGAAAAVASQYFAPDPNAYYDPSYHPADVAVPAAAAAAAVPAAAAGAAAAEGQDWGVDYGPAKPLQHFSS